MKYILRAIDTRKVPQDSLSGYPDKLNVTVSFEGEGLEEVLEGVRSLLSSVGFCGSTVRKIGVCEEEQ